MSIPQFKNPLDTLPAETLDPAKRQWILQKDESTIQMQNKRGEWVPALTYPFYTLGRHKCSCGKKFWKNYNYQAHYALEHIVLGNKQL